MVNHLNHRGFYRRISRRKSGRLSLVAKTMALRSAVGYRAPGSSAHASQNANQTRGDNGRCLLQPNIRRTRKDHGKVLVRLSRGSKNGTGKCDSHSSHSGSDRSNPVHCSAQHQPKRGAGRVFAHVLIMADKLSRTRLKSVINSGLMGICASVFYPTVLWSLAARPSAHH